MALPQGHQLGKTLLQNVWKIISAFSLGLVAVVGGGLILSDVYRIPQGSRSSGTFESSTPKGYNGESRPLEIPQDHTNIAPSPAKALEESSDIVSAPPVVGQNENDRSSRAKSTPFKVPKRKRAAENRDAVSASSALPASAGQALAPVAEPALSQSVTQLLNSAEADRSADSVLTIAPETPITVRLIQQVSTKENHKGEVFKGTLALPLTTKGMTVAEAGAPVVGRIVDARTARLFRGGSNLNLELTQVGTVDGRLSQVRTTQWYETGSHSKVAKAAIVSGEAAKKVSGAIAREKDEPNGDPEAPQRTLAESSDATEKSGKKAGAVNLPSGSEIVFRLIDPLTIKR